MEKKRIALLEPDDGTPKIKLTDAQRSRVVIEFFLKSNKISRGEREHLEFLRIQQALEETARNMEELFKPFLQSKGVAKLVGVGLKRYLAAQELSITR